MSTWRLIYNPQSDAYEGVAYASAVAEGKVSGKYLSGKSSPNTVIIQGAKKKGVICETEVLVEKEKAKELDIDVAKRPRAGRGGASPVGTIYFSELMLKGKKAFKAASVEPDDLAALLYTSGTTGKPKGVMLCQRNFLAEGQAIQESMESSSKDIVVCILPLFHIYSLACILVSSIFSGTAVILIPQYNPLHVLEEIKKYQATVFFAVPTQYIHLLQVAAEREISLEPTLRACFSGAAPLPVKVLQDFEETFGTTIVEGYGLTECCGASTINPLQGKKKPGSIGKPLPGIEVEIHDDEGNPVPQGEQGEIVVKGPVVMLGYYNLPEETAKTIVNEWLKTGDIGYQDEEGYLYVVDRKKELIISGGFNIYPREIEEFLNSHPAVRETAVIGVEDSKYGEVCQAFVTLIKNAETTESELMEYCNQNLAAYKVPRQIKIRESLPKSLSGKVIKKELQDEYVDERLV